MLLLSFGSRFQDIFVVTLCVVTFLLLWLNTVTKTMNTWRGLFGLTFPERWEFIMARRYGSKCCACQQDQEARTHFSNSMKQKEQTGGKHTPVSSQRLPLSKLELLNFPRHSHQPRTKSSNNRTYWGHFSFKPLHLFYNVAFFKGWITSFVFHKVFLLSGVVLLASFSPKLHSWNLV